jgi:hypothetical protein
VTQSGRPPRISLLRWQFDGAWALLELHLGALTDEDHLWEPAGGCWSVRDRGDGTWLADWQEPEPDPAPPASIGWLTWHVGWWWTGALAAAQGSRPKNPGEVPWPGSAALTAQWLRDLRSDWIDVLDRLTEPDLDAPASFPWRNRGDRTVAHMAGWVNIELMKNAAEIGQLRRLRTASTA